jgi:aspartyl-tRNA synthetase
MLINTLGKLFVLVGIDKFDSRLKYRWLHLRRDEIKKHTRIKHARNTANPSVTSLCTFAEIDLGKSQFPESVH